MLLQQPPDTDVFGGCCVKGNAMFSLITKLKIKYHRSVWTNLILSSYKMADSATVYQLREEGLLIRGPRIKVRLKHIDRVEEIKMGKTDFQSWLKVEYHTREGEAGVLYLTDARWFGARRALKGNDALARLLRPA